MRNAIHRGGVRRLGGGQHGARRAKPAKRALGALRRACGGVGPTGWGGGMQPLESRFLMTIVQPAGQDYLAFEGENSEATITDLDGDGFTWEVVTVPAANGVNTAPSGGAAIESHRDPSGGVVNDEGQISYPIQLTNAGPYFLYARTKYSSGGDNSMYVPPDGGPIDDEPSPQWDNNAEALGDYHWNLTNNAGAVFSYTNPTPGAPTTIKLNIREGLYFVDRVVLSETAKTPAQLDITAAPTPPQAFPGNNAVALRFLKPGSGAYNIKRATSAAGPFTTIGTSAGTDFIDNTAVNGTQYFYVLSLANSAGESPNSEATSVTPSATAVPATPTNVQIRPTSPTDFTISFTPSPFATSYNILQAPTAAGPFTQVGTTSGNSFVVRNLGPAGEDFFFVVTAANAAGQSPQSSPPVVAIAGRGVRAGYFNDHGWGAGNFGQSTRDPSETLRPGRPDVVDFVQMVDFNFAGGSPNPAIRGDNHSTVWTGKVTIPDDPTDGPGGTVDVTFISNTDDNGVIYVNGQEVSEDMTPHGQRDATNNTAITLTQGQSYNFVQFQNEQGGDSGVHFKWLNPLTGANEAVPAQYLSFAMDTPVAPGLSAGTLSTSPQRMVTFDVTDNSPAELSFELLRDGVVVATAEMNAATIADSQPITGSHTYTLRAVNYDGTSPASGPQVVDVPADFYADATTGASAYYFNSFSWNGGHVGGPDLSGGPNIVAAGVPDYQETVPQIDFDYGATGNTPNPAICTDGFSTVHTGKLALPEDANGNGTPNETIDVQFVGNTDDHGIYFVNGQVAAQDLRPRAQGDYTNAGPLTLKEGQQYDFVIFQAEQFGGAGVHFKWNNPNGGALEPISGDLLTPRTGAPAAPTGVSGNGQGNFVALNWTDNATSEVAYLIERGAAAAGPFTPIGFSAVNATSFADTTVKPDTNYFYRVTAVNYEGKGAAAVLPVSSGTLTAPNATPITAGVARRAGPRIAFTDTSTNEALFTVQRRLPSQPDSAFADVGTVAASSPGSSGATLYFQDTTGAVGQTYVYRVVASNSVGATNGPSFTLANTPASGTGLKAEYFEEYFNTRDQFVPGTGITFRDPVAAVETFGGGDPGPAGLGGGGGNNGPVGVDVATGQPANIDPETFSGLFTGLFRPEFTGPYTFLTNSDDGVSFQLLDPGPNGTFGDADDVALVDFDNSGALRAMGAGFADTDGTVNLTAGKYYQVIASFAENTGGAGYRFGYSNPNTGTEAIPTELLFQTVIENGPQITQVFVNGQGLTGQTTANGQAFRAMAGIDNTFGYPIPTGANQLKSIPWVNGINQVSLRFTQDVASELQQGDLVVRGVNNATYTVSGFAYDAGTKTGTWTLSTPITNDKVRLFLDDALVTGLDGEWADGTDTFPSGDGTAGGDFAFRFNVLRGDATQDGRVNALDLSFIKQRLNKTATNPGTTGAVYSPFADLTADGSINALDLSAARARLNNALPTGEPATALLFSTKAISR